MIVTSPDEVGDISRVSALIEHARSGDSNVYEMLAAMPLEEVGIAPEDIPSLPVDSVPCALFWRTLALARVGDPYASRRFEPP
ncbi:MAG: hypothetical protein GY809_22895 [Planctomycetes bacterium]|nr:hypothetical protein [Planctomycetota bacterium]